MNKYVNYRKELILNNIFMFLRAVPVKKNCKLRSE